MGGRPAAFPQASFAMPPPLSLFKEQRKSGGPVSLPTIQQSVTSRKGSAWTEAEHMAFLKGLQSFGKGQWKQISRYYVPSRTPTQVASHAQKHFLRLSGATKRRSRFASVEDHATGTSTAPVPSGSQPTPPTHKAGPEQPVTSAAFSFGTSAQSMSVTAATLRVPPPVSADGVAVGIPVILPVPPCGVSGAIPMLRTLPGRITAPMAYSTAPVVEKARSPLPLRQQPAPRKPTTAPPSVTRPAPPEQWGEPRRSLRQTLKGGVSRKASRPGLHHHHHGSSGHAYSAASGSSDTGHYALDALAGVAAALADSAASMSD